MAGLWSIIPSTAVARVPLRTTPPGPSSRAVTAAQERWDVWERRGDRVARTERLRAQVALAAATLAALLYIWLV